MIILLIICLAVLAMMFGIGFKITGALLSAVIWLFIKVPFAFVIILVGIICCCTLILIPVGIWLFKIGITLLVPGRVI